MYQLCPLPPFSFTFLLYQPGHVLPRIPRIRAQTTSVAIPSDGNAQVFLATEGLSSGYDIHQVAMVVYHVCFMSKLPGLSGLAVELLVPLWEMPLRAANSEHRSQARFRGVSESSRQ